MKKYKFRKAKDYIGAVLILMAIIILILIFSIHYLFYSNKIIGFVGLIISFILLYRIMKLLSIVILLTEYLEFKIDFAVSVTIELNKKYDDWIEENLFLLNKL